MPTAENARLYMEAGQNLVAMALLTDSGDHLKFTAASGLWSRVAGFAPVVRANGVRSGLAITPTANNNEVQTSAGEVNLNGVVTSVPADTAVAITRTPAGGAFQINSITVDSTGAVVGVAGTEGSAFSETRAAAGGPPLIAAASIEIGQVRLTSNTDGVVVASEIKQVPGTHMEMALYPLYSLDHHAGAVTFVSALPLIHTGTVAKRTYAEYYTPELAAVAEASNFKFPEETFSITSEQTYDGARASSSKALGQGGFDVLLQDGVNDLVAQNAGKNLWWRFFPDRNQTAKGEFQGFLGLTRTFPADGAMKATCTVSAEKKATEVA